MMKTVQKDKASGRRSHRQSRVIPRLMGFLMVVVFLFGMLPAKPVSASEADEETKTEVSVSKGMTVRIKWERVKSQEDLPQTYNDNNNYYAFIAWEHYGTIKYCTMEPTNYGQWSNMQTGKDYVLGTDRAFTINYNSTDSFYTLSSHGMPKIKYLGKDKGNNSSDGGYPTYKIQLASQKNNQSKSGYDYGRKLDYHHNNKNCFVLSDEGANWSFAFSEQRGRYSASARRYGYWNSFAVYSSISGTDVGWVRDENTLKCTYDSDYDDFDPFYLWIGKEEEVTCITEDINIQNGQVLNIRDQLIILDHVTVTIEPGGLVSVGVGMVNNGRIENYGTLIFQENASVSPFDTRNKSGGAIINHGSKATRRGSPGEGVFILMNGSVLLEPYDLGKVELKDGSYLLNYGSLVLDRLTVDNYSYLENRGNLCAGYRVTNVPINPTFKVSVTNNQLMITDGPILKSEATQKVESKMESGPSERLRMVQSVVTIFDHKPTISNHAKLVNFGSIFMPCTENELRGYPTDEAVYESRGGTYYQQL